MTDTLQLLLDEAQRLDQTAHLSREGHTQRIGLSIAQARVLRRLEKAPLTVAALARRLGQARQSVQRVTDTLVRSGLLEPRDNPDHKRAPLFVPTDEGARRAAALREVESNWLDAAHAVLPSSTFDPTTDLGPAVEALRVVRSALESGLEPPQETTP